MVGKTLSHGTPTREPRHRGCFACGHRPARVSVTPSARSARLKWPWAWPWTEASPALCGDFFLLVFIFDYISRNCINLKMCRKYNTTQKNIKQIFVESLRVDLGFRLDKIHFCTLLPSVKLLQLKP
jgi:hypothetical protein